MYERIERTVTVEVEGGRASGVRIAPMLPDERWGAVVVDGEGPQETALPVLGQAGDGRGAERDRERGAIAALAVAIRDLDCGYRSRDLDRESLREAVETALGCGVDPRDVDCGLFRTLVGPERFEAAPPEDGED